MILNKYSRVINLIVKIILVIFSLLLVLDFIYKIINKISYITKEKCIFYRTLPKFWFLIFEYFIEPFILIFIGIFVAIIIEKYFSKFNRIIPKNPITAFIYASLIPVCACSVIPLLITLNDKIKKTTLFTYFIAAPLLNPFIIFMSFNLLGIKYGILRILTSFILAIFCGYILGLLSEKKDDLFKLSLLCNNKKCDNNKVDDIYLKTYNYFIMLLPFLVISSTLSILLEYYIPNSINFLIEADSSIFGRIIIILIGIPMYLCNGTDIIILRPFLHAGFNLGSAIAFSLTVSSICITSLIMVIKIYNIKVMALLTFCIFICILILSMLIDLLEKMS